jgi:hypothetical protein
MLEVFTAPANVEALVDFELAQLWNSRPFFLLSFNGVRRNARNMGPEIAEEAEDIHSQWQAEWMGKERISPRPLCYLCLKVSSSSQGR